MSRRMFILTRFFDRSSRALSMQLSVPLYCSHFHQGWENNADQITNFFEK